MSTILLRSGEKDFFITDTIRMSIWSKCYNLYIDMLGIGTGIGSISKSLMEVPHNMFLEALVQYGFFALYFFILLIKQAKKGLYSKNRSIKIITSTVYLPLPLMAVIDSSYLLSPYLFASFATFYMIIFYSDNYINLSK